MKREIVALFLLAIQVGLLRLIGLNFIDSLGIMFIMIIYGANERFNV